jgi:Tfp pilus assembly protein PilF
LYDQEKYEDARERAKKGLDADDGDARLNLLVARTYLAEREYREALPYAQKAFESDSVRGEAGRVLGKLQWELGQPIKAVGSWRAAREVDPRLVSDADFKRGLEAAIATAMSVQDYESALELRAELAELAPEHPQVADKLIRDNREKLAQAYIRDGQYEEAASLYAELLADYPKQHSYALEKGRLHVQLDQVDKATEAFTAYVDAEKTGKLDRALEVAQRSIDLESPTLAIRFYERALEELSGQPTFRRAKLRLTLADLYYKQERADDAPAAVSAYLEDMEALRGLPLDAEVFMTAADIAAQNGETKFEIDLLEQALQNAPPSWNVAAKLAELYARRARSAEVERVLKTFVERSGDTPEAKLQVARWAQDRRNYALAETFYESVVEQVDGRQNVWLELARVYSTLGKVDKLEFALQTYQRKFDLGRYEYLDVASMYLEHRMYESAEKALLKARELDSKSLVVVDRLARLYTEWGRPEKIHRYYEKWAEARGGDPQDYLLIGDRFIRRGDTIQALPYLERAAEAGASEAWLQIADVYRDQRRDLDMKRALDKYLDGVSSTPSNLRRVLTRYRTSGMDKEAIDILERLIETEPNRLGHYEALSQLYSDQGREQDALDLWKSYLNRSSDRINALRDIEQTLQRRRMLPRMLDIYSYLLEDGISDPRLYRLIGDTYLSISAYQRQGRYALGTPVADPRQKARRFYELYLDKGSPTESELRDLAQRTQADGMWDLSAQVYEQLIDGVPDSSELRLMYGEVLINLGRIDQAMAIFDSYYESRGELLDDAQTIARNLVMAKQFDAAEPYLDKMFSSGRTDLVNAAFTRFMSIYTSTGARDELPGLINKYLENAQNPTSARSTVLEQLERLGLYAEAAEQIRRIRRFQGDVKGLDLGKNLFKAGKTDEATEAFREYANNHSYSSDAWIVVGAFYWSRGQTELAKKALDRAISVGPDNAKAYVQRGRFRLMHGEVEAGREDFAEAREKQPRTQRADSWRTEIETLEDIGRFELAAEAARAALANAGRHEEYFIIVVASRDLASTEPVRRQRILTEVEKSTISLREKVSLLTRHDFHAEAIDLLESEVKSGDYETAARTILSFPWLLTEFGGYDRLERALKPALDKAGSGAWLSGRLGAYFLDQGEYERGIPYLRAAVESGNARPRYGYPFPYDYRLHLGQAYAALGLQDAASAHFMGYLEDVRMPEITDEEALDDIGTRYELLNERQAFFQFLEQLLDHPRFRSVAAARLVRYSADKGDLADALDVIRRVAFPRSDAQPDSASQLDVLMRTQTSERLDTTIAAIESLAAGGYVQEAYNVAESLPEDVAQDDRAVDLRLRLAAMQSEEVARRVAEEQIKPLGDSPEAMAERLGIARVLQVNGHVGLALEIARPAMEATDYATRSEAARFLIGNAFVRDDLDAMDQADRRLIESGANTLDAHRTIADRYFTMGVDDRALQHYKRVSDTFPTPTNLKNTLGAALASNDEETYRETLALYLRTLDSPQSWLTDSAEEWMRRSDWAFSEPLLDFRARVSPASFEGRMNRVVSLAYAGRVEDAREVVDEYLQLVDRDPQAIEEVLMALRNGGLHAEVVRVGRASDGELTPLSLFFLGTSSMELGLHDDARSHFDTYLERSPDKSVAGSNVADWLVRNDREDHVAHYANAALQAASGRVKPYFYRGIANLEKGELEQARRDFKRSLGPGVNRTSAVNQAARVALRANHDEFAVELMRRLTHRPVASDLRMGLSTAIATFQEADRSAFGVDFLESEYPRSAAGDGILATNFRTVTILSGLYEAAGLTDMAHETYRRVIHKQLATNPTAGDITTYLNNLAYSFSTTNTHIDEGLDMIRRSVATVNRRAPSYIDTVGWLYYRAGDHERALEWVRRSLRLPRSNPGSIRELLDHMAVLYNELGQTEKAAWYLIRMRAEPEL